MWFPKGFSAVTKDSKENTQTPRGEHRATCSRLIGWTFAAIMREEVLAMNRKNTRAKCLAAMAAVLSAFLISAAPAKADHHDGGFFFGFPFPPFPVPVPVPVYAPPPPRYYPRPVVYVAPHPAYYHPVYYGPYYAPVYVGPGYYYARPYYYGHYGRPYRYPRHHHHRHGY